MTLIEFLTARLDQDETDWKHQQAEGLSGDNPWMVDPMLREIGAKRRILARYEDCLARMEDPDYSAATARDQAREYEDFVLPALAAVWSDHPDYDPAWA